MMNLVVKSEDQNAFQYMNLSLGSTAQGILHEMIRLAHVTDHGDIALRSRPIGHCEAQLSMMNPDPSLFTLGQDKIKRVERFPLDPGDTLPITGCEVGIGIKVNHGRLSFFSQWYESVSLSPAELLIVIDNTPMLSGAASDTSR